MSTAAVAEFAAGATFGGALLLSGVFSPAVITSQLRLSNFHMLEAFLTASAVSATVVLLAEKSGYSPTRIREPRSLAFGGVPYSANLVGGGALGVGMALTGACPGTVLVQIATGVKSGLYVGAGGLLGGVLFSLLEPFILAVPRTTPADPRAVGEVKQGVKDSKVKVRPDSPAGTLQNKFGISTDAMLLTYEAMCLAMLTASVGLAPKTTAAYLPPALGGLFIGAAQAATLLMTRRTVGVSGAYGAIGRWLVQALQGKAGGGKLLTPSVIFALGILGGSAALASRPGVVPAGLTASQSPEPLTAFLGGVASIFGASLAGGCTSGHGISGMATLSIASFLTVAAMFGGGIAAASFL